MSLYVDHACLVDTQYLVAVTQFDGEVELDGVYYMDIILCVGRKPRRILARYHTQESRNVAYRALCDKACSCFAKHGEREDTDA